MSAGVYIYRPNGLLCTYNTWASALLVLDNRAMPEPLNVGRADVTHVFFYVMVHIGQEIKDELARQERPVAWFAKHLCCDRRNIYNIFLKQSIDCELLMRISNILDKDFFKILSDDFLQNRNTGCDE